MFLLTLVAALSQPLPIANAAPAAPSSTMLGAAPAVCNPDQMKGLACHMNKAHAQTREYHARRQAAAAAACDAKQGDMRGCTRLSVEENGKRPLSD